MNVSYKSSQANNPDLLPTSRVLILQDGRPSPPQNSNKDPKFLTSQAHEKAINPKDPNLHMKDESEDSIKDSEDGLLIPVSQHHQRITNGR